MSELSDALLPTPPLPVSRTFIQLLGCIVLKKNPIFWEFFGRSPTFQSGIFVSFLRQIQTVEIQFPFFFLNFSQDFHPPYQLVTKQSFPTKFGLGKTERTSLVTSPTYIRGTSFQSLVLRNADLVLSEGESRCQDAGFCCGKIEGVGISL